MSTSPPSETPPATPPATPPPGTSGHGRGLTSIRRLSGKVFRSDTTDEWVIRFEVICPDCGDDGGPFEDQPDGVRAVRGPYPDVAAARRGVAEHTGAARAGG